MLIGLCSYKNILAIWVHSWWKLTLTQIVSLRAFSFVLTAILNFQEGCRCTLVPRLPFPVPRSPFPVPGISSIPCSSHFVSSCLSEMFGVGLVSGLFLRLGFTLGYCFFLFEEKRVRVLDYSCWLYSSPQAILKLSQSARRQVVTVTESGVSVHLITCIPGYKCSCLEHLTWQILS